VASSAVRDKLLAKHDVTFGEVEEVCLWGPARERVWRAGREETTLLFGRTFAGRYLLVVLSEQGSGVWRVVTARDMTGGEHRTYRKQRRGRT